MTLAAGKGTGATGGVSNGIGGTMSIAGGKAARLAAR